MLRGEVLDDPLEQRLGQPLRERAIGAARAVGIEAAREQVEADVKHLLGGEVARAVERVLEALPLRHKRLDPRAHRLVAEARVEIEAARRIDRGVEHMRPSRDHFRQPRGAAEHVAEQFAQGSIRAQDRHELDACGHARQRFIESGKRCVGVARPGEGLEQRGRELRQHFARAGAAHRSAPAEMPAANGLRRRFRALKAERAERGEGRGIVGDAGEDEVAGGGAERRRVLEQPCVVLLDPGQVMGEIAGEALEPRIAAEFGEARKRCALERKALRLLVGDHLEAMFDAAQKDVSLGEVVDRFGAHPLVG